MQAGLIVLCLAYVLSQFFRAFLAVLAAALGTDIGATAEDLAFASGMWFLVFAAMQLPLGWALDRIGPRRTAAGLVAVGMGGGSALFAAATAPWQVSVAMGLIGLGCSPALMASYYIFAREYPPARFATLAALMLGIGSAGNILASYPTAWAADLIGWRATMAAVATLGIGVAAGIFAAVRDPAPVAGDTRGSVLDLLRMPLLWPIFALMLVNYAPAGAIRGLWIGPYLNDVYGMAPRQIGQATLAMGVAMILGTFFFGPLDRLFRSRKGVVLAGNLACAVATLALAYWIDASAWQVIALMALVGFTGATYPVIIAHARGFFPPHLAGRGVTLINLFGIGGIGVMQLVSGRMHAAAAAEVADPAAPYQAIFLFFGLALALGVALYAFSRDNME